jgi:CubicO group peptidase (beta-lactamase class C family)
MCTKINFATLLHWALVFALVAFGAGHAAAAASASASRPKASDAEVARFFDDYMAGTIKRLDIPGGAVVVVRDGRPILAKGYGYADLASRRPVDVETTLFRAASASKIVPWMLAMQLVEEGRLDLDRDVNDYLDFRIPEAFGRPVTMRHLMTHTAGFPERFHGVFDQDVSQPLGRRLRDNIPERNYAPGTTIAYSNYGAALAGYIVERLRRQPWERVVEERFFKPVGMRNSTVLQPVPESIRKRLASTYSYGSNEPGPFRFTPLAPMGALTPTAADMGRLLAMLVRGGQGENGRVVAPATLRRMFRVQKAFGPGLEDGFGLGFLVGDYHGVHYGGHAGNMTTLATDLEVLPDHGLGWYYVFNSQGPNEEARQVRDDLLMAAIDRFASGGEFAVRAHGPSSAGDVAGTYISTRRIFRGPLMFSGLFNTTEAVAGKDGSLDIQSGGKVTHWLPAGRDRFVEAGSGIPLAVTRGSDGRVQRIGSAALYAAAIFERAPGIVAWGPVVAAFGFGTLLLAVLVKPFAWLVARRRRRRSGETANARISWTGRWSRRAFWTIVLTIAGWGAFGLCLAINFLFLFTAPPIIGLALGVLTLLSAPCAAILAADAAAAWRDPGRGWASRGWGSVVAAGALAASFTFYRFDVIILSGQW